MIKTLNKIGLEETYLKIINTKYENPQVNIIMNEENPKTLPFISGTRQGFPVSPFLYNTVLQVLTITIRQRRKNASKQENKK